MVQNVANSNNPGYGQVQRVGNTADGRVVYEISNPQSKQVGRISVAAKDCDVFEKSYNDLIKSAPLMEDFMKTATPESMKALEKKAKRTIGISGAIGGLIPALLIKGKWYWQTLGAAGGLILGLLAGGKIAKKTTTPPGADTFARATENLSKLDIKQA